MEPKKNKKYDLERKSPLFFAIGLVVALLCVTLAFEWKGEYDPVDLNPKEPEFIEPYVVTPTMFPKPKPPRPVEKKEMLKPKESFIIVPTDEVKSIIDEIEEPLVEDDFNKLVVEDPLPPEPTPPDFFDVVETMPQYPGGIEGFYKHISRELDYPHQAKRNGISGRVYVQFIIDEEGKLTEVKAIKGIGFGCDEEAVRVIKNAPKWKPGKQRGRPVKVRMVLPIVFSLQQ
jgi:protein TonB